ncbi:MAG: SDR family oxidoreductase [Actinomycetota bacterium]|nr:SDR family oxidoreductase [Actinomycetota bacterium]
MITGAGSGIGRAAASALAGAGAAVVCADVDGKAAEATAADIASAGGAATSVAVDVTDASAMDGLARHAAELHDGIDAWVNVAGIMRYGKVVDLTEADLDAVLAVNFKGMLFGSQVAARRMVEQGSGSIINVASAILDGPQPRMVAYAVSKAAVSVMTRTMAMEIGKHGVRANVVAPGWTRTGMTDEQFVDPDGQLDESAADAMTAMQAQFTPLRRVAEPSDAAAAVLYLASDSARFVTGQTLRPHGGITMPW